jgi:hypothetical protein
MAATAELIGKVSGLMNAGVKDFTANRARSGIETSETAAIKMVVWSIIRTAEIFLTNWDLHQQGSTPAQQKTIRTIRQILHYASNYLSESSSTREMKSTLKNINYYHGSTVNSIKSLSRGQEYSTPDKKDIEADIVWITPSIGYAYLFTDVSGTIYKVKPTKTLNIFDAGAGRDFDNLVTFYGILRNGKDPHKCLMNIFENKKIYLNQFQKMMAEGDWSDLDVSGLDRADWINTVIRMGYDGYLDHEKLEGRKPTTTIGIFNPKNLKIIGSIPGEQIEDMFRKNPNRVLALNEL